MWSEGSVCPLTFGNGDKEMTTDTETVVRRACHAAEGNVMDVQGFIDLCANDGVFNAVGQEGDGSCA